MNKLIIAVVVLAALAVSTYASCQDSCVGRPNGQYPCACRGCPHYYECNNGLLKYRVCGGHSCYNPFSYRCNPYCVTGYHGIYSCVGRRDGDYQHCYLCTSFVKCSNGILSVVPCPYPLVWDDHRKRCEWHSNTCQCRYYN